MLESEGHINILQQHLYKLYQDGSMCDIDIISQDGITFRAHKLVLTACSRYLYNVCMQMAPDGRFMFDIQSEILHILLEFCYTGKLFISTDSWASIQEAANFLQMYTILELLDRQSCQGTSTSFSNVGNQSLITLNKLTECNKESESCYEVGQTELEGQSCQMNEETFDDFREIIIKQEVPVQDKKGKLEMSTEGNCCYATRSRSQRNTNSLLNQKKDSGNVELENESRRRSKRSKSASVKEVKGRKNSRKVTGDDRGSETATSNKKNFSDDELVTKPRRRQKMIENDPDYELCRTKIKGKTLNNVRSRSKKNIAEVRGVNLIGEECKDKMLIRIKDFKIVQKGNCKRKSNIGNNLVRICVPKSYSRTCPQCSKMFTSAVNLHIHQLYTHFSSYCSQLRCNHLTKIAKRKSLINCYLFHKVEGIFKFECKVCKCKFSKYCEFTLHHRKRHRSNTVESWLRYCSVKLAMQKLLVPFAKDRKLNLATHSKSNTVVSAKSVREKTFQCVDCNKMFLTRYTLSTHRRKIHGEVSSHAVVPREKTVPPEALFVCVDCRKSQRSIRALCNHLQVKHNYTSRQANQLQHCFPDSLQCEACEFRTKNLQKLKSHIIATHPSVRYQCSDCPMTFKVPLMLKRHRFLCHVLGKFNFHCQVCQKAFRKGSMLRKHEYFKHSIPHDNIKIFRCQHEGCSYQTYASTAIKLHQSKHNKEKLFPCEYCALKLKTEKIREKHVAKMHLGIRPFLCQVCGLSFGEKHELQSHITNRHSSEKNYHCQYCSYTTAVKGTFFTHLFNVHKVRAEDDKRELFRCPHCPFTSILKYRFQTHVNGHTNTRNYECKICNKSFVSANTLRSHNQWVHSDKVYSCSQCDYQTKTSQKLNEHIRVQHQLQGFKPYKCPYCSFRCATGGNTRKHVKQVHKGEVVTYIRDDDLLAAARMARASGHYASLFNTLSGVQLTHEVSEDERSELSENILHIAL